MKIEIETTNQWKLLTIIAFCMLVITVAYAFGLATGSQNTAAPASPTTSAQITTPTYPTVLTFTVLSTTTAYGHYQITTTTGQILYFNDYYIWDTIKPQNTYTATITGMDGDAYLITSIVLVAYHYDRVYYSNGYYDDYYRVVDRYDSEYPKYYYYEGSWYQWDGENLDKITHKQAMGERIIYAKPPHML